MPKLIYYFNGTGESNVFPYQNGNTSIINVLQKLTENVHGQVGRCLQGCGLDEYGSFDPQAAFVGSRVKPQVEEVAKEIIRSLRESNEKVVVTAIGFSRGACSALLLPKVLQEKGVKPEQVDVNVLALEPTPGNPLATDSLYTLASQILGRSLFSSFDIEDLSTCRLLKNVYILLNAKPYVEKISIPSVMGFSSQVFEFEIPPVLPRVHSDSQLTVDFLPSDHLELVEFEVTTAWQQKPSVRAASLVGNLLFHQMILFMQSVDIQFNWEALALDDLLINQERLIPEVVAPLLEATRGIDSTRFVYNTDGQIFTDPSAMYLNQFHQQLSVETQFFNPASCMLQLGKRPAHLNRYTSGSSSSSEPSAYRQSYQPSPAVFLPSTSSSFHVNPSSVSPCLSKPIGPLEYLQRKNPDKEFSRPATSPNSSSYNFFRCFFNTAYLIKPMSNSRPIETMVPSSIHSGGMSSLTSAQSPIELSSSSSSDVYTGSDQHSYLEEPHWPPSTRFMERRHSASSSSSSSSFTQSSSSNQYDPINWTEQVDTEIIAPVEDSIPDKWKTGFDV